MQIAGRQWAAAFATAVLLHAGVLSAVLWHAPSERVRHVAPAHVRVSLGAAAGTSDGVSVAAPEVAEAGLATAGEVIAASSAEGWTPAVPEPPTLRPIGAAAVRAIESVRVAFDAAPVDPADSTLVEPPDAAPVEPEDSTLVEESLPVESAPATSVEATRDAEVAEAARLEESSPMTPVDVSPSIEAEAVRAIELIRVAFGASPVEPADSTLVEESLPVESAPATSVEATRDGEVAEAARLEESSPVKLVDASPSIEAAAVQAIESVGAALDASPVEPADSAPIEESVPVEHSQVKPAEVLPGVEFADVAPIEESPPVKPVDAPLAVEPAEAKPTDAMSARELAEAAPVRTSTRVDPAVDAVRVGTSSPVEPVRAEPMPASLAGEPNEETLIGPRLAVESAQATSVEALPPGETAGVIPVEVAVIRQAVPATQLDPPADLVVANSAPLVSREPERFDSARAPMMRQPSRERRRESRRAAAIPDPAPQGQPVARARSTPDGRVETGSSYSVAGAATPTGGSAPRANTDYLALVQAWLEKHKEYPFRARLRREEGTAVLYFVVDRDGRVRDSELRQSTGHALLDREVLAMIERAQPLPRVPGDPNSVPLELIVPVRFRLR